ncbi:MAG: M48 family metalloprotease, partial [Leptospiraceae bacterium]|nr:M48 family metalloprotease [Leptospiraceae bacterium]
SISQCLRITPKARNFYLINDGDDYHGTMPRLTDQEEIEHIFEKWTSTPYGRRSFLAIAPTILTACISGDRNREGDNTGQETSMTVEDERALTQSVLPELQKDYPRMQNAAVQNYVNRVGQTIVARNGLYKNPYTYSFTVVEAPYPNAFALPAGTVFVTKPLMGLAETEAELAGVLGHEIGHIKARHVAERMEEEKNGWNFWKYIFGGAGIGALLGYGIGRAACRGNKACENKATIVGAGVGAGIGYLVSKYAYFANSQEDEMEADRVAFNTSVGAGYDKQYVGRFYERLLEIQEAGDDEEANPLFSKLSDAMQTHPPAEERVEQMHQMQTSLGGRGKGVVSTPYFDQIQKICNA